MRSAWGWSPTVRQVQVSKLPGPRSCACRKLQSYTTISPAPGPVRGLGDNSSKEPFGNEATQDRESAALQGNSRDR